MGGTVRSGDLYIGKSVILRFVLDTLKSGSFKLTVKKQSNNDAHGYVIFVPTLAVSLYGQLAIVVVYIAYWRGLRRCSF